MPYIATDEDKKLMLINLPNVPSYANMFHVRKKEYQIVQKEHTEVFYILLKTIEEISRHPYVDNPCNLIKTIRIIQVSPYEGKFVEKKSILLE